MNHFFQQTKCYLATNKVKIQVCIPNMSFFALLQRFSPRFRRFWRTFGEGRRFESPSTSKKNFDQLWDLAIVIQTVIFLDPVVVIMFYPARLNTQCDVIFDCILWGIRSYCLMHLLLHLILQQRLNTPCRFRLWHSEVCYSEVLL